MWTIGLNRESSYSPSVTAGLGGLIRGPRGLSLGSFKSADTTKKNPATYLDDSNSKVDQIVDSVLLRYR
jgi:hypothetical protein